MHYSLTLLFARTSLLVCSVLASPTPSVSVETRPRNINSIDAATSNTRLGYYPPDGPTQFTCTVVAVSALAIQPRDLFVNVIDMLEDITQGDFKSRMPQAETLFFGPNNLAITVSSVNPTLPILRRFVMWAIVRIILTMRRTELLGYYAAVFEPKWQGQKVGTIEVGIHRAPNNQLGVNSATGSLESPTIRQASTNTTTTVGNDQVWWTYQYQPAGPLSPLLTQWDVAMGSIGALVEAARHSTHNFDFFHGNLLPDARAVCIYRSSVQPSRLSKTILIRTIAAAARWALNDGDFHALAVKVMIDRQEIARGGYNQLGPVLSASNNSAVVNTSQRMQ